MVERLYTADLKSAEPSSCGFESRPWYQPSPLGLGFFSINVFVGRLHPRYTIRVQFQVPQNITMEDKIIGPLSPIQFGIVTIGGLAAFVIFSSDGLPSPINKIIGFFLAMITLALAMGKFNDQPLYSFTKYIILFVTSPKTRVWKKNGGMEPVLVKPTQRSGAADQAKVIKHVRKNDIAQLATILDSRGTVGKSPTIATSRGTTKS